MTVQDMNEFHSELEKHNHGRWIKLVGELHHHYREAPVWILVENASVIDSIYKDIRPILLKYLDKYADSRPTLGFSSKISGKSYLWTHLTDKEIRNAALPPLDNGAPDIIPLRNSDVFGTNPEFKGV